MPTIAIDKAALFEELEKEYGPNSAPKRGAPI
jgi:hypothetical protein